uniref:Pentatricopeptide repeat-containing protein n=1 Tax=Kalanchoe fedtschenkoi TaxID=63787 RepID=A0A7N0T294_KALFE
MPASQGRFVNLIVADFFDSFFYLSKSNETSRLSGALPLMIARRLSSVDESFTGGGRGRDEVITERRGSEGSEGGQDPPHPIPNRQLRGERRNEFQPKTAARGGSGGGGNMFFDRERSRGRGQSGGFRDGGDEGAAKRSSSSFGFLKTPLAGNDDKMRAGDRFLDKSKLGVDEGGAKQFPSSSFEFLKKPLTVDDEERQAGDRFLDKFKLSGDQREKSAASPTLELPKADVGSVVTLTETKPEDADEIFKKMKENGLIPNAVAMLDGLCKDGLVQEAMKLFKLMREKGQIPEVVIYTAVVEGFCKSHKFDDAKRIFRKMQSNGIVPNAYTYTVLIQGFLRCSKVDDSIEFCLEMLEAGHSPNLVTFVGLVNGVANDRGVEEAQKVINSLREKGYFVDEKAVRNYLDKNAPALPLVWEAVLGKRSSQSLF